MDLLSYRTLEVNPPEKKKYNKCHLMTPKGAKIRLPPFPERKPSGVAEEPPEPEILRSNAPPCIPQCSCSMPFDPI